MFRMLRSQSSVTTLLCSVCSGHYVQNVQVTKLGHYTAMFSMLRSLCSEYSGHQARSLHCYAQYSKVTTEVITFSMLRSLHW